jgi:transcription initiation factor TFIIH subunit 1
MAPVPIIQGAAAYKRKDGKLSIAKDQKSIQWFPVGVRDTEKAVTIAVANITSK